MIPIIIIRSPLTTTVWKNWECTLVQRYQRNRRFGAGI